MGTLEGRKARTSDRMAGRWRDSGSTFYTKAPIKEDERVSDNYRLSIVLPAHNEESNVATAIKRAAEAASRLCSDYEIVIVDDGSTDATADVVRAEAAENPHVRLVSHDKNRGYGEALHTGFRAATMDLVFFTDADNQF
ncbi:MAG: glycosyltransferase family 2 protein, partial [Actinobacteria bacterium]